MRAMVMDIKNKHMVVMKEDGTFEKVKVRAGKSIGDEIMLSESSVDWKKLNRYVGIAASVMLVLLGSWQVKAYYTPYGSVNIDINPSIQLGFNKYERIISTKGLNVDGVKILQKMPSIKHSKLEDATRSIVKTASDNNYIKKDQENNIMFSIYTPNSEKNKALNTKINSSVLQYLKSSGRKAELINEIVSKEDLDRATLQKISVGKLKLYEKAKAVNPSVTIDDIKDKPVRDIIKMIRTAKDENGDKNNQSNDKRTKIDNGESVSDKVSSPSDEGSNNNTEGNNPNSKEILNSDRNKLKKFKQPESDGSIYYGLEQSDVSKPLNNSHRVNRD